MKNKEKKEVHLIAHSHPKLSISEQYRLIRTNILYSSVDEEIKSIMVTSPEALMVSLQQQQILLLFLHNKECLYY